MASPPLNYLVRPPSTTLVDQSAGFAQWSSALISGDGTLSLSDNLDPLYLWNGATQSLKVVITPGASNTRYQLTVVLPGSTHQDWHNAGVQWYVKPGSGSLGVCQFQLGDTTLANRFNWDARNGTGVGTWLFGHNVTVLNRTYRNSATGSPAFGTTTFARLRLDIQAQTGSGPVTIYLGNVIKNFYTKPQVYLVFDDQAASIYSEAFSYMQPRSIVGSLAVATNLGFGFTEAQVNDMLAAGWSIHNHSHAHTTYSGQSKAFVLNDIATAKAFLAARGWNRNLIFVAPGGTMDATGEQAIVEAGYPYNVVGDALSGYSDQYPTFQGLARKETIARCINREATSAAGLAYFLSRLTDAITTGSSLGMLFHSVGGSELSVADFRLLIDQLYRYRQGGLIDIVNLETFVARFVLGRFSR